MGLLDVVDSGRVETGMCFGCCHIGLAVNRALLSIGMSCCVSAYDFLCLCSTRKRTTIPTNIAARGMKAPKQR